MNFIPLPGPLALNAIYMLIIQPWLLPWTSDSLHPTQQLQLEV